MVDCQIAGSDGNVKRTPTDSAEMPAAASMMELVVRSFRTMPGVYCQGSASRSVSCGAGKTIPKPGDEIWTCPEREQHKCCSNQEITAVLPVSEDQKPHAYCEQAEFHVVHVDPSLVSPTLQLRQFQRRVPLGPNPGEAAD